MKSTSCGVSPHLACIRFRTGATGNRIRSARSGLWKRLLAGFLIIIPPVYAQQQPFFADGYHGGIYGHYPVEWKTRFIADQLEAHPEWRIGLEIEPETWDTVAVRTPHDYSRFKELTTGPRVEFTNPTYAQPYCYNISAESIIRQFDYGMRKIRSHFPEAEIVTYAVEEPCFTSCLPQILKLFGFKYASLKCPNTCWGGYTAPFGGETVLWIGPDGSTIPTVPRYACEELQERSVWQTTAWGNQSDYLQACARQGIRHPIGMCYQDAGWKNGPWIGSGDSIRNRSIYVTWREYFERFADTTRAEAYRMSQEDIRVSLMWGSQVLQRIAREVRHSENNLIVTEKMGAIAHLVNGYLPNQSDLDEAWRTLMLAQHHDSWIVPYNGLHHHGTWAEHIHRWTEASDSLCTRLTAAASRSLMSAAGSGEQRRIRVYNTLGIKRREVISIALPKEIDAAGVAVKDVRGRRVESVLARTEMGIRELFFEAAVPAFGYADFALVKVEGTAADTGKQTVTTGNVIIENDTYRLTIDPARGGVITSLIAKKLANREFVDPDSDYAFGELRGYFYDEHRFHSSTECPAEVTLLCDNSLMKRIQICGTIASHPFTETITLRKGDRKIDFDLRIDWKGNPGIGAFREKNAFAQNRRACYDDRYKLNIYFPAELRAPQLWKDAPFDVCKSRLEDTHFTTWNAIKHNILLHWVDLAEPDGKAGLALLTDHTTAYIYGNDSPLGLTIQYSGSGLWGCDYPIDRPTHLHFAIAAHNRTWDEAGVHDENLRWNEPLRCEITTGYPSETCSLIDLGESGYEISAAYPEAQGLIVRLYNASGDEQTRPVRFGFPVTKVEQTDLCGNRIGSLAVHPCKYGSEVEIALPRFGITTLRLTQ